MSLCCSLQRKSPAQNKNKKQNSKRNENKEKWLSIQINENWSHFVQKIKWNWYRCCSFPSSSCSFSSFAFAEENARNCVSRTKLHAFEAYKNRKLGMKKWFHTKMKFFSSPVVRWLLSSPFNFFPLFHLFWHFEIFFHATLNIKMMYISFHLLLLLRKAIRLEITFQFVKSKRFIWTRKNNEK